MMLSGFFSNADNFVPYLIPFKYFSLFKWGYQLFVYNEFDENSILYCNNPPNECFALGDVNFDESYNVSIGVSIAVGAFYGVFGFCMIYFFNKIKF